MNQGLGYAVIAASAFGLWTTFQQLAARHVHRLVGAIGISLTAVLLGLVVLVPSRRSIELPASPKGILFTLLAGCCAFAIDYFALKTYSTGIEVSTAAPIIVGGSMVVASIAGLVLGERLGVEKALGIGLVILGATVLSRAR